MSLSYGCLYHTQELPDFLEETIATEAQRSDPVTRNYCFHVIIISRRIPRLSVTPHTSSTDPDRNYSTVSRCKIRRRYLPHSVGAADIMSFSPISFPESRRDICNVGAGQSQSWCCRSTPRDVPLFVARALPNGSRSRALYVHDSLGSNLVCHQSCAGDGHSAIKEELSLCDGVMRRLRGILRGSGKSAPSSSYPTCLGPASTAFSSSNINTSPTLTPIDSKLFHPSGKTLLTDQSYTYKPGSPFFTAAQSHSLELPPWLLPKALTSKLSSCTRGKNRILLPMLELYQSMLLP
jgi:hypothetical protein